MRKRQDLPDRLAERVDRTGDLVDLLWTAVLRQDERWVLDQMAGRKSVV